MTYESPSDFSILQKVQEVKKDYEEQIKALNEKLDNFKLREEKLNRDIEKLNETHQQEIGNLQQSHEDEIEDLKTKYRKMISDKENKYEALRLEMEDFKKEMSPKKKSKFF